MNDNMQQTNKIVRPAPMRPNAQPQAGMTPKEIFGIIRRHLVLIIFCTFLGTIAGGAGWYLMREHLPKYTATTAIEVKSPVITDPMAFGGDQPNKDLYYQFRNTKAAFMQQQSFREELLRKDAVRKTGWYRKFDNNISDAVDDLKKHLRVSPQRDEDWIIVTMTCGNAGEAAGIVNEAVKLFIQRQQEIAEGGSSNQLGELEAQRVRIDSDLKSQEENLRGMRQGTDYANLEPTGFRSYLDETMATTQTNRDDLEGQIAQLKVTIGLLKGRLDGDYSDIISEQVERDSVAIAIRQRLTFMEQDLAQQLSRFGERHRRIRELKDAIAQLNDDLDQRKLMIGDITRRSRVLGAEDAETAMVAQLKIYEEQRQTAQFKYRNLSILKAEYARIVTLRDEKQTTMQELNTHIEKLKAMHDNPDLSKVKQVFLAPEPLKMSSPNIIIYIPAGVILGLLAGFGLAFLIEIRNDLLRTPSDIAKHLRVPLLGAICHANEDKDIKGVDLYQVTRQAPYSMMSEGYRQLRTNLRLSDSGSSKKVLLVTSPSIGCGKTTVAANLALTLASEGRKILLIDTHFRKPSTSGIFPHTGVDGTVSRSDIGLSNYLMGQCESKDVVRPSGLEGLNVIDSGALPSNPDGLLGNKNMASLLENAGHEYDYVIIDGPPMIVSSAQVLASQAEGTILVFNTSATKRGEALRTLRELREVNANVVGTVLVGIRAMKGGYFHERYRTYRKYQKTQIPAAV